jgi:hypothetical protein
MTRQLVTNWQIAHAYIKNIVNKKPGVVKEKLIIIAQQVTDGSGAVDKMRRSPMFFDTRGIFTYCTLFDMFSSSLLVKK